MRFTTNRRHSFRPLCLTLVCLALAVFLAYDSSASAQVTPPVPVSAYLFDEGSGTTTEDSFGSNDGAFASGVSNFPSWRSWTAADPTPETPFGYEGNSSLSFGGNDWVDLGNPADLDFVAENDPYTISAWFSTTAGGAVVGKAARTLTERQYYIWVDSNASINTAIGGEFTDYFNNPPDRRASGAPAWEHVAIVVESNTVAKIYVNGVLGLTSTIDPGTATLPDTNIYVGARLRANATDNSQAEFFFQGRIDEVAFWDSALSQENIDWLQSNSLSTLPVSLDGDFNGDSDIDGSDFLSWQRDLGDATNLGLWVENFGTIGAVSTVSAVPEPTTVLLTGFGAFLAMNLRSVRRRP